jgi:hypothetical protein
MTGKKSKGRISNRDRKKRALRKIFQSETGRYRLTSVESGKEEKGNKYI